MRANTDWSSCAAVATLIAYACAAFISCAFYQPTRHIGWMMVRSFALKR
jgi:hypothetical protein